MKKTAILMDELFLEHDPGYDHVESPQRLEVIYKALDRPDIREKFSFPGFSPAAREIIEYNHAPSHFDRVASTAGKSFEILDPDTRTSPRSFEAACLAAGSVVEAAKMVHERKYDNCFALVRPPGHHAEKDRSMGFCLFNNVAVAAHYAIRDLGLERVLIVDWDLHHGNGTQNAFYDTDNVFYFSTHQYPYYPGSGGLRETGTGKGEGYTLNVPLPGGQNDRFFAAVFNDVLTPVVRQYKPQMIMVSAGYDIYHGDPLGGMAVTERGFAYMTGVLKKLAGEVCGGKLLFTLEGGYNLQGLRDGVLAGLRELAGESILDAASLESLQKSTLEDSSLDSIRNVVKGFWQL